MYCLILVLPRFEEYSNNINSTQIKNNAFKNEVKSNKVNINKEKLDNLYEANQSNQSVVLNLEKKDILKGSK